MNSSCEGPHFEVTAGLLFRSGEVLISRRRKGSHLGGMWEFPGGKKEAGETLEECLRRELAEELGIKTEVQKHCLTVHHTYDDRSVSLHVFHCLLVEGDPKPLESDAVAWVGLAELENYQFPPPDRKILAYLRRHSTGNKHSAGAAGRQ